MLRSVSLSKNLIDKFVDFESPKLKSSGKRVVLTATFNPSRSIGGDIAPE